MPRRLYSFDGAKSEKGQSERNFRKASRKAYTEEFARRESGKRCLKQRQNIFKSDIVDIRCERRIIRAANRSTSQIGATAQADVVDGSVIGSRRARSVGEWESSRGRRGARQRELDYRHAGELTTLLRRPGHTAYGATHQRAKQVVKNPNASRSHASQDSKREIQEYPRHPVFQIALGVWNWLTRYAMKDGTTQKTTV